MLVVDAGLATLATVLFIGALYQMLHVNSRKYGTAIFILIMMFLIAVPTIAGAMMCSTRLPMYVMIGQGLLYLTPITQFMRFVTENQELRYFDLEPYLMIAGYIVLTVLCLLYTWNWVRRRGVRVENVKTNLFHLPSAEPQASCAY
jgi:hypothetical protein